VGFAGYLAFGNSVKSVVIYNLPNHDPMAITVKICYLVTIMGSFVLIAQPIFGVIERTQCYKFGSLCCKQKDHPNYEPQDKKDNAALNLSQ
jgi:amino acid permease